MRPTTSATHQAGPGSESDQASSVACGSSSGHATSAPISPTTEHASSTPDRSATSAPISPTTEHASSTPDRSATSSPHRPPPADRKTRHARFRRANTLIAFASSMAVMLGTVTYLLTTPEEPNRPLLWALQGAAVLIGATVVWIAGRRRTSPTLMHLWSTSQLLLATAAAAADGGIRSPFLAFLFVPLAVTTLALRPRPTILHSATAVVGIVVAGYVTDTLHLGVVAMWTACLGSLVLVMLGIADNTRRLTRRLEAANAELLELSRRDPLTGCLNHRSFHEEVDAALARAERRDAPVALALLDIDHFKQVNDTYGHPAGDAVLVAVADALRASTRSGDLVARTGGEEFAILFPDSGLADASRLAERVRCAVAEAGGPAAVTVSAGVAAFPDDGHTSTRLIQVADRALYDAKEEGRDRVVTAPR